MPISHYKSMEKLLEISRPYLYIGFCPDPKHFIVNFEQNSVKYADKWGRGGGGAGSEQYNIYINYFNNNNKIIIIIIMPTDHTSFFQS